MTFQVCNLSSNQPHFNRAYVVRVCLFSATTVALGDFWRQGEGENQKIGKDVFYGWSPTLTACNFDAN